MTGHKHAELYKQMAKDAEKSDKLWEFWQWFNAHWSQWRDCEESDHLFNPFLEYRRKPETIRIGDYELPKPLTEEPIPGEIVFAFTPESLNGYSKMVYSKAECAMSNLCFKNLSLFEKESQAIEWVKWWKETVIGQLK